MPKYLFHVNYVGDGIKGLLRDGGTKRKEVTEKLINSVGGKIESFYFAFGETDLYIIADMPDSAASASISLTSAATGMIAGKTTVLITPEELDKAVKIKPTYQPPGR